MTTNSVDMDGLIYDVIIVGGGPAGLRAAELVSATGLRTVLTDHKLSVGRKFLVAGRGGLNLTHSEPVEHFPARYGHSPERWQKLLADFSPDDLRAWAKELGIETFVGTSGRVFPESKQAAPLLRRWTERLRKQGVAFRTRHKLTGFQHESGTWKITFAAPQGDVAMHSRAIVFALGGASWPQTGSDGGWAKVFSGAGIPVTHLVPANCGYEIRWTDSFLNQAEGRPLKNIVVHAGDESISGELLITQYGIEGGAIYQLGRALRAMAHPHITIDLKPDFSPDQLVAKLGTSSGSPNLLEKASKAWRLNHVAQALLKLHAPFDSAEELAALAKVLPIHLHGPRPIEEAISTAGGVPWDELDDHLMLKRCPGLFCAGEMIDWDAPTGGYLLQGCFSTATRAALGVKLFLTK